ncbi:MAG: hypothetical protein ACUVWO_04430 [Thermodesulfobacteriota bacterium]
MDGMNLMPSLWMIFSRGKPRLAHKEHDRCFVVPKVLLRRQDGPILFVGKVDTAHAPVDLQATAQCVKKIPSYSVGTGIGI